MADIDKVFKMTEIPNSEIATILAEIAEEGKFDVIQQTQDAHNETWTLIVRRKK